jgi:predicted dehydrogenase
MQVWKDQSNMRDIGIGIVGTGFMGKAHAFAYRSALAAFPDIPTPRLVCIADVNAESATKAALQYGFAKSTGDWKQLIADPEVQVVSITTPNTLHKDGPCRHCGRQTRSLRKASFAHAERFR